MTYEEAIEEVVTREEAMREIAKHGGDGWAEFVEDHGDHPSYPGATVLGWLGY